MRSPGPALLAIAGSMLVGTTPAAAQNVRENVRVDVVTVRLTARDKAGHPVLDLKPSDVALSIDGRAQAIDTLTLVHSGSEAAVPGDSGAGGAVSREPAPRTAIFLDEGETKVSDRTKVYGEIASYLGRSNGTDELLVARFTGSRMEIVTPWTTDRGAVSAALNRLVSQPAKQRMVSTSEAARGIRSGSVISGGGSAGSLGAIEMDMDLNTYRSRLEAALLEVLAAFPTEPSTKRVILVSSGTVLARPADLAAAFESPHVEQLSPGNVTCSSVACLRKVEANRSAFIMWGRAGSRAQGGQALSMDDVIVKALEHDVALVPVAADPFAGGQDIGLDSRYVPPADTVSFHGGAIKALWEIAEQSGGEPILVAGKTGARLGEIGNRAEYELTFRDPFADDHHLHSIGLVSRRPGVAIDYRRGYRVLPDDERTLDAVVARLVRSADAGSGDGGFALSLSPAGGGGDVTRVRLTYTAPAARDLGDTRDFVIIAVGQRDDGARTDPVRFEAVGERANEDSTEYTAVSDLKVPYGRYTWSIAVRDADTGLTSYSVVNTASGK